MQTCNECKFAIFKDHGYSNYTVEGIHFTCAIKKHPDVVTEEGFDRYYGTDERLNYAEKCLEFTVGDPISICVEGDYDKPLTPEQEEIIHPNYLSLRVFKEVGN